VTDEPRPEEGENAPPSDTGGPDLLGRLDPDRARPAPPASSEGAPPSPGPAAPAPLSAQTRRYRRVIGVVGLGLLLIASIYQLAAHRSGSIGVPPGQRLHLFAAPLANTSLVGDPNLQPPCSLARHDPRALNICLLVNRGPLVLSFFVTGEGQCQQQVDALQRLSARFSAEGVQFAAVAVNGSRAATAALIRSHHWTIPVAYDRDGSVGALYGVAICPMAELVNQGGIVSQRLLGNHWNSPSALGPEVARLAAGGHRR
jgi:peroxiredoxin